MAARLHRSTGAEPGARFVGLTEWESINDFLAAAVATEAYGIGMRFAGVPVLYTDVRSVRASRGLSSPMRSAA